MDRSRLGQAIVDAPFVSFVLLVGSRGGARLAYFGGPERPLAEGAKS